MRAKLMGFLVVGLLFPGLLAGCSGASNGSGANPSPPTQVPIVSQLSPASATAGSASLTLYVTGQNFIAASVITWNGQARSTSFVSSTELQTTLAASDLATAGTVSVEVTNGTGYSSNPLGFAVTAAGPVAPTINDLAPQSAGAGSSGLTLTVYGDNYDSTCQITWNGVAQQTQFSSINENLTTSLTAAELATPGTFTVAVKNGAGQVSSAATFTVTPLGANAPVVTSVSPSAMYVGDTSLTLTVLGTNISSTGAKIIFAGLERTSISVPGGLQATLYASDVTTVQTVPVGIVNSNGKESATVPLTIYPAATSPPALTSLSPPDVLAGSPATTVTLTGTNLAPYSVVTFTYGASAAQTLPATYVSSTQMTVVVPATYLATVGSAILTVATPGISQSASLPLLVYAADTGATAILNMTVNDMVWDPVNQVIYASVPSGAIGQNNQLNGAVQVIHPATAQLGQAVNFGNAEPGVLAVSETSRYLYMAQGLQGVNQLNLPGLTSNTSIPMGTDSNVGVLLADEIAASPVSDETIAVVLGGVKVPAGQVGVAIFDGAVQRPNFLCGPSESSCPNPLVLFNSVQWNASGTIMYASDTTETNAFSSIPVGAQGFGSVTFYDPVAGGNPLYPPDLGAIHFDATTGDVFTDSGYVIDPSTQTSIGSIVGGLVVPDGTLGVVFSLTQVYGASGAIAGDYTLRWYDINTLKLVGSMAIPDLYGSATKMIRWGTNGIAIGTVAYDTNPNGMGALYLFTGTF